MERFGWCLIGAGGIAENVLRDTPGMRVVSVYTRSPEHAQRFVREHGGTAARTLEEAVLAPGVEGVYVCTTNPSHYACALRALEFGKPVLCEKPMTLHAEDTRRLIDAAHSAGVFLMEGMWTRFNPVLRQALRWLEEGAAGEAAHLEANFGLRLPDGPASRVYRRRLGGGCFADMGVYPLWLAQMLLGTGARVRAVSSALTEDGVDRRTAVLLDYSGGRTASLFTALDVATPCTAAICCTCGRLLVPDFWRARRAELRLENGAVQTIERTDDCTGWRYQIEAAEGYIREGRAEAPEATLRESLDAAITTDEILRRAGVRYDPA